MGLLRVIKGKYENRDAVKYVIRYITRTRLNETRKMELIAAGSLGTSETSEKMIEDFLKVQKFLRPPGGIGKKINHEVFLLTAEETNQLGYPNTVQFLYEAAQECARLFYNKGFQVVFALHIDMEKGVHYHFAVNTVNFINGRKWSCSIKDMKERGKLFQAIVEKYQRIEVGCYRQPKVIAPLCFYNKKYNFKLENPCYYVAVGGEIEGIFDNWEDCELRTGDDLEVRYRRFSSMELANCYISNEINWGKKYIMVLGDIEMFFDDYEMFISCLEKVERNLKNAYGITGLNS